MFYPNNGVAPLRGAALHLLRHPPEDFVQGGLGALLGIAQEACPQRLHCGLGRAGEASAGGASNRLLHTSSGVRVKGITV